MHMKLHTLIEFGHMEEENEDERVKMYEENHRIGMFKRDDLSLEGCGLT